MTAPVRDRWWTRRRVLALLGGWAVVLGAALGAATNLSTGLPLPNSWSWARSPAVMWTLVGVFTCLLVAASVLSLLVEPGTPARVGPEPPGWADRGDAVAVRLGSLPDHVRGRDAIIGWLVRRRREGGLVVLAGPGGSGKSTVARELVRRTGPDRSRTWEVSAATPTGLLAGMITVARELGGDEEDLEAIATGLPSGPDRLWRLLERAPKGWLLIVDNADEIEFLARPPLAGSRVTRTVGEDTGWTRTTRRGLVLVTSRRRDERAWPDGAVVHRVGALPEADAARVLLDEAGGGDLAEATGLARRLGGLPLALRLAGRYVGSDYVDDRGFAAYHQRLDADPRAVRHLRLDPDDPEGDDRSTVTRTWELSLDALARHGLPEARPLLRLLSCFAPSVAVRTSLLRSGIVVPFLRAALADVRLNGRVDPGIDQVLRGLDRLGLIDRSDVDDVRRTGAAARRRPATAAVVHPVIADTNRVHLLEPQEGDPPELLVRHTAVALLATDVDSLTYDEPASWPAFRSLVPHLQALVANSAPRLADDDLLELTRAVCYAASSCEQMQAPQLGADLAGSVLAEAGRRDLELGETLSLARQQHAHLLAAVGRNAEAEVVYREILADQQRRWPDDDPGNLVIRHGLARVIAAQGRVPEAETALSGVLAQERRVLGERHPATLAARSDLATFMAQRGDWNEALVALRELLGDTRRAVGEGAPFTLTTRHNIAVVLWHQGERRTAAAAIAELLADERRLLGDEHFITAATRQLEAEHFLHCNLLGTPGLREDLAVDLFDTGIEMTERGRRDDALRAYREVIDRFGDDAAGRLREIAARAELQVGHLLASGKPIERARAMTTFEELEGRFADDPEPALRRVSAEGLTRLARLLHDCGDRVGALRIAERAVHRCRELVEAGYGPARGELARAEKVLAQVSATNVAD